MRKKASDPPRSDGGNPSSKAEFARELTRNLFGRHYWNDRLETELREQLRKSQARVRKGRDKAR